MRVFAISDVHGCNQTLQRLIYQQIKLKPADRLYLLGDYVNRGPDSLGVIDTVLNLQARGYDVHALRGNHEDRLIHTVEAGILQLEDRHLNFLHNLHMYQTWHHYILVHAGLNFQAADPLADDYAMRWIRNWEEEVDEAWLKGRQVIFGHIRRARLRIEQAVAEQRAAICIDNGCFDLVNPEQGQLCAYELTQQQLFFQPNIDMDTPEITYLSELSINS